MKKSNIKKLKNVILLNDAIGSAELPFKLGYQNVT